MTHTRSTGRFLYAVTFLGMVLGSSILGGCGGGGDYSGPPEPGYRNFTLVLNVSDADGYALGDATVWVDGTAQDGRTSWDFVTLGTGYPESWRGFRANWIQGGYRVVLDEYTGRADITVMVSKTGYTTQATTFHFDESLPKDVYGRDTFIMERSTSTSSAEPGTPVMKPQPGEVIGKNAAAK
jgi:hypothetical protein